MRKQLLKHRVWLLGFSALLVANAIVPILSLAVEKKIPASSSISFQPNIIPDVNVYYRNYSFVFEYKSFFIRIRPFVIYDGSYYGMRKIVTFIKNSYPNINYKWLIDKATDAIHYGYNLTKLPQNVADKIDYLGFRLADLNFPLAWFKLEVVEVPDEVDPYNTTLIRIPKANLVFSFHDLYSQGYSVEHLNSTYILVGQVKGKTDLIVDPITYSSPNIVVTGGDAGSPVDMEDVYDADNAGTSQILAPTQFHLTETRQFLRSADTINGLYARKLDPVIPGGPGVFPYLIGNATLLTGYWGTRFWKRVENGTEYELTSGVPVAQVNKSTATLGYQNATWSCPETALLPTAAIVARFYLKVPPLFDWTVLQQDGLDWITEQLGGRELVGTTWTIYYYTAIVLEAGAYWYLTYSSISGVYETRIENFQWLRYLTLTQQVSPADDLALKLNLIITSLSDSGNTTIDGFDKDGVAQTETVIITANTTYITSKWWQNVTLLTCYGDYTIEVTQSRWGVVWRTTPLDGDEEQYYVEGPTLVLGDDSTPTYFKLTDVQVYFYTSRTRWATHIRVEKNVWFQLGEVEDANAKTVRYGVQLFFDHPNDALVYGMGFSGDATTAYRFYGSTFSNGLIDLGSNNITIWSCTFLSSPMSDANWGDFDRLTLSRGYMHNVFGALNDVFIYNTNPGYAYNRRYGAGSHEITNLKVRNTTYLLRLEAFDGTLNVVDADTDTWAIQWRVYYWDSEGEVNRRYSFDLTVVYDNGTAIPNVNATLTDVDNSTVFSYLTDSNGQISTQKVTYVFYNQTDPYNATATSTYLKSPHNLTLTRSGLQTYTVIFNMTEKMAWTIVLAPTSAAFNEGFGGGFIIAFVILLPLAVAMLFIGPRLKNRGRQKDER